MALRPHPKTNPILADETIFYDILPWLPLQSLLRFKLVCKEWNKVISKDTALRLSHTIRNLTHPPALLYRGSSNNYMLLDQSLKSFSLADNMVIRDSTNGLLCGTYTSTDQNGIQCSYFWIWNFFTNEDPVYIRDWYRLQHVSLAFEPSSCYPHFTLVCPYIMTSPINPITMNFVYFRLYSSAIGKWRTSNSKTRIYRVAYSRLSLDDRPVYVGGKSYWKMAGDVVWLHVEEESGGIVALPDRDTGGPLGEIGGCNGELSYTKVSPGNINIWILRSNKDSEFMWEQKSCLMLEEIFKNCVRQMPDCCSRAVSQLLNRSAKLFLSRSIERKAEMGKHLRPFPFEGGEIFFWVLHGKEGVIFCYNMRNGVLRVVHNSQMKQNGCFFFHRSCFAPVPIPISSASSSTQGLLVFGQLQHCLGNLLKLVPL